MIQERAVTMAERDPQVERAAASLRWTGSWYTVFVAAEPHSGGNLPPPLAASLIQELEKYRLAGQDLDIDSPHYMSLDIALAVCVDPDYFDCDLVGRRRFAMQPARRPAVDWAMADWFHFAADCLALLILAIAEAGLVGIVVSALRDP